MIVPSRDLIRRTLDVEIAYTLSRISVLARLDGNPVGIATRKAGQHGMAYVARHFLIPSFNAIAGLEAGDADALADVLRWCHDNGSRPQIELVPGFEDEALVRALVRLGYHQSGFHVSMIARPGEAVAPDAALDVARINDKATLEHFLDAYIAGRELPDGEGFKRNVRPWWLDLPGWALFLGRVGGAPAAAAIVYVREGFAYLADAATDPKFRGRGLQAALLAHRLRHAAEHGAEYACSGASFLSTSHRNMVRAGMTLQFVRAVWTPV